MSATPATVPGQLGGTRRWVRGVLVSVALVDAVLVLAARRGSEETEAVAPRAESAAESAVAPVLAAVAADPADSAPLAASPSEAAPAPAKPKPRLSAGVADVAKLAQAGVDEAVLRSYIETSPVAFYLTPDEIIHLRGLGLSSENISSMIHRGANLREQSAQAYAESTRAASSAQLSAPSAPQAPAPVVSQTFNYGAPPSYGIPAYAPSVVAECATRRLPSVSVIHVRQSPVRVHVPFYARFRPYYDFNHSFYRYGVPRHRYAGPYFGYGAGYHHGHFRSFRHCF